MSGLLWCWNTCVNPEIVITSIDCVLNGKGKAVMRKKDRRRDLGRQRGRLRMVGVYTVY